MVILLLVLIIRVSICSADAAKPGLRVYKGKNDTENEFPFIVLLYSTSTTQFTMRHCTGSLIAENWVLTAAHCIRKTQPNEIRVRYGDFTLPPNKTSLHVRIIKLFTHPTWNIKIMKQIPPRDDIGLVLVEHIPKKPVKLLALDYKTLFGLPVKYAGFGFTTLTRTEKDFLKSIKTPLQVGEGILVPCHNFKGFGTIVCVAGKCSNKMQETQNGDSGGPLVYDGRIIGVLKGTGVGPHISMGGAFTPVSIYLQWMKQVMSSHGQQTSTKRRT